MGSYFRPKAHVRGVSSAVDSSRFLLKKKSHDNLSPNEGRLLIWVDAKKENVGHLGQYIITGTATSLSLNCCFVSYYQLRDYLYSCEVNLI